MAYGGNGAAGLAAMASGMNMSTTAPTLATPSMKPKCGSTGPLKVYDLPIHVIGLCMFTIFSLIATQLTPDNLSSRARLFVFW